MAAFDGNIKEIRLKLGLSQEDLAYRIGVSLSTVQRWEQNSRRPSRLALKALATGGIGTGSADSRRPVALGRPGGSRGQPAAAVDGQHEIGDTTDFDGDIREIRLKLGWSRQRLAHEIGVSQSTLHRWEYHHTRPSGLAVRQLRRILERSDVSPGWKGGVKGQIKGSPGRNPGTKA